jgi:hypothetical protein
MKSVVKVQWKRPDSQPWKAELLLAGKTGFESRGLQQGRKISLELTNERRCTGYAHAPGERTPCPEFRIIDSGSQCPECRGKDIYSDYVRGAQNTLEGEFSVYYAQIGEKFKVGVTRSENVPKRWIEQGADYAAEIESGLTSNEALDIEDQLTTEKITQRIRKENKIGRPEEKLTEIMDGKDRYAEIVDVQELTDYPELEGKFMRKGLIEGEIESVKGQIISNGRVALALTSGKVLKRPEQRGLKNF